MNWSLTVAEILELVGSSETRGDYRGHISGLADLREAQPGQMSFLKGGKYSQYLKESEASVVLVPAEQAGDPRQNQLWILVKNPSESLTKVCSHIEKIILPKPVMGIHPTAIIAPSAQLDPTVGVGPNCIIGEGARIGAGTILESNVRIEKEAEIGENTFLGHCAVVGWGCKVGNRCRLFQGTVIGADGFGYTSDKTGHKPIPQIGIVVVEDDVDLGAHTCIDRARFSETRVKQGTKVDNLVQIGHNNIIGRHNIICAQVGMAGSNHLGDFCVFAGQVGIAGHRKLGDGVIGTGQTDISNDTPAGTVLSGTPGRPHKTMMRQQVRVSQLEDLFKRVKALEDAGK